MSFRGTRSAASLRLYSLPRRELQALCKQHGIPANKTNVKMADALSAVIPAENAQAKAWASSSSLGVSKTTPMKLKTERKTALPETSLASLILTGKRKVSPVKPSFVVDMEDSSFPKPNTTPLKRGIKRTERPMEIVHEEKAVSAAPVFTRAAAAALHEGTSLNSPKPREPTPRKRTAGLAAVVTRRGGDALPPVSFSDLLSTPKRSVPLVAEAIQLSSIGRTAKKIKSMLGANRSSPKDDENKAFPLPHVSRGKRVAFADEVEFEKKRITESKDSNPARNQRDPPEPETEIIEASYAEIEFRNSPLHRELLGVRKSSPVDQEQDVPKETEQMELVSESLVQQGFEFRDMVLHKELFGSQSETNNRRAETSTAHAVGSEASELGISKPSFVCSPEILDYSNTRLGQQDAVLSSIREDASDEPDTSVKEIFAQRTQNHLQQGCDLSPLLDDMACDDRAGSRSENLMVLPVGGDTQSPESASNELQDDSIPTSAPEPVFTSPSPDVPVVIEEDNTLQEPDFHTLNAVVNFSVDNVFETETTHLSSTPVLDGEPEIQTCSAPEPEVSESRQGLGEKIETEASPSAEGVIASGSKQKMSDSSVFNFPVTQMRDIQNDPQSAFARSKKEVLSNIDSTLAKATAMLSKFAALRADIGRISERSWESTFSLVVENASPTAALNTPVPKPAAVVNKDLPSAQKARPSPKATSGSEKALVVCEDADIVSKGEVPSLKTTRTSDESRASSEVLDKENQGEKNMGDGRSRKLGVVGKEKSKVKKFEVLKDRSKNVSNHATVENAHGTVKAATGQVRPEDMSLRKLRALVKGKIRP